MGKTAAPKQRHECCLERLYSLKEVGKSPFPTDGIADQQCEKVDGFIRSEAPAHQAHGARAKASRSPCCSRKRAMMTTSANHAGTQKRFSEVVCTSIPGLDIMGTATS